MALNFLNDGYFAGKVGIGAPAASKSLEVTGNAQVEGTLTVKTDSNNIRLLDINDSTVSFSVGVNGKFQIRDVAGVTSPFQIEKAAANNSLYIKADGKVGIGTNLPGGKLDVTYPGTGGTGTFGIGEGLNISSLSPNITFNDTSTNVDNYAIHLNQSVFTLGRYTSATSQSPDLVLVAGKVGIGTTNPQAKLHVNTSDTTKFIGTNADYVANSAGSGVLITTGASTGNTYSQIYAFQSGNTTYANLVVPGGNVGIGTTNPAQNFVVADATNGNGIELVPGASATIQAYNRGASTYTNLNIDSAENRVRSFGATVFNNGSGLSEKMRIDSNGNVGIGTTSPGQKLHVVSTTNDNATANTVKISHARSDTDFPTNALYIDMNLSGADTTTADRTNRGIFVDIDSTANGDAANEYRIRGVNSDVRFSGFSDVVQAGYFYAESNNNTVKTAQLMGVYGNSVHDSSTTDGGVSNMYGVYGLADIHDLGDVDNAFGGFFQVNIGTARGNANVGVTKGVEGQINIDKAQTIDYDTMMAISAVIDNNEGAVPNFGNQFLFKGDYQGDKGANAYGIYCEGDKHYLQGSLGISTSGPTQVLHVVGNARVTGAYYDSNNSPGTANQVLISTVTGTDWVDGSAIPGVPGGSGTLNTIPLWTPDGDTLGDSPITISGNDIISSGRGVIENTTNLTTGVADSLLIKTLSSGTSITNGFGAGLSFYLENTVYSAVNEVAKIAVIETDTIAIDDKMVFSVKDNNILAERLTLTGQEAVFTGNVGIGTTLPATDLHVNSENAEGSLTLSRGGNNMVSGQGVGSIVFPADYNGTPTNYGKIVTYANALSALRGSIDLKVKSTSGNLLTGLTVYGTSSGVNVGIGTTSPDAILETSKEVDGNQVGALLTNTRQAGTADSVSLNFGLGRTADGFIFNTPAIKLLKEQQWTGTGSTVDGALVFSTIQNETVSERARITSTGHLQVSTGYFELTSQPTTKLWLTTNQVQLYAGGLLVFGGYNSSNDGVVVGNETGDVNVTLAGGANDKVLYLEGSSGNVGIGTKTPQSKLQVAGGIQMADDTATASAAKVGTMRYRTGTEYVDVTGTNLISNPDFTSDTAWNKETGWTISGGELVATAAAGNTACYQSPGLTNGSIYRCTFTISEYTSGKVSFRAGTAAANTFFDAVGTYSVIMTAGGTLQGRFGLESGVTTTLKISQCSIVEVVAEDASYADMCMQTGSSTYEWVNIVRNTY